MVIIERDDVDDPIVVPILWDAYQKLNIVLSVYGRSANGRLTGDEWIRTQLARAARENGGLFISKGFAGAKPKPEPANATSWSPGLIPVDRPAKHRCDILRLPQTINEPDA